MHAKSSTRRGASRIPEIAIAWCKYQFSKKINLVINLIFVLFKLKNPEDETQEGSTTQLQSTLELHETTLEKTIDQTAEKPKSPKSPKSPRQLSANKKKEAAAAAAVAKKGKKTPNDSSENSQADGERKKY